MKKIITAFTIVLGISSCLLEDKLNLPFGSFEPQEINDGLTISSPSGENMDLAALTEIYEEANSSDDLWSLRSMLIFRNGNLVSEAYFKNEEDITDRHLIWSCTKQVMGILAGIAVDKGLIESLDDPISKYLPEELGDHPEKAGITVRNLISMQSGIDFSNDGVSGQTDKLLRQIPENSVEFILSLPMKATPGTAFHYNDGDPHLLSAVISKAAGKPTDEWANEVFFSKIRVTNLNWVRYPDGITFGGFGIETTPRELGKIALCVAKIGKSSEDQIISSDWVESMTSPQVDLEADYDFGYYWWIDSTRDLHFMWGHGGQFAFVIPSKDLVVVFTSIPNTQGKYQISADEVLPLVDRVTEASF